MGDQEQAWIQFVAQAVEAVVWLGLVAWCLEKMRPQVWARLAAIGAMLMFVPACTLLAARAQLLIGDEVTILQNYANSSLPTTYAVLRVVAALLLLAAVVVGRGAGRPTAVATVGTSA